MKGRYGGRSNGKRVHNGGFSGNPTVDYSNISQETWDSIFGKKENVSDGEKSEKENQ
jgi:hypothetical protein